MGYQKLAPNQEDHIRDMRARGKTPQECSEYMNETYDIDVPEWKISYITGKKPTKIGSRMPAPSKMKRKYKKKGDRLAVGPADYMNDKEAQIRAIEEKLGLKVPVEQAVSDITKGLEQIFAGYTAIFMQLRLMVIKEKGKVFNMAKAAGIQITGEDIQE